jgi:hypothetical protein
MQHTLRSFPEGIPMPEKETIERAKKDMKSGKSPTTAAGEFVREEIHHIREGKHGAKNAKQAIAIGLSEARRAGVPIKDKGGSSGKATRSGKSGSKRGGASRSTGSSARSGKSTTQRASRKTPARGSTRAGSGGTRSGSGGTRSGSGGKRSSATRARAALKALKRQPRAAASHRALSRQARGAAKKRPASARSAAARKAARTRASR